MSLKLMKTNDNEVTENDWETALRARWGRHGLRMCEIYHLERVSGQRGY